MFAIVVAALGAMADDDTEEEPSWRVLDASPGRDSFTATVGRAP
jgi:hypothetical protein